MVCAVCAADWGLFCGEGGFRAERLIRISGTVAIHLFEVEFHMVLFGQNLRFYIISGFMNGTTEFSQNKLRMMVLSFVIGNK